MFDTASNASKEALAIPDETLTGPRLAAADSRLFFMQGTVDSDIWLVRFGEK